MSILALKNYFLKGLFPLRNYLNTKQSWLLPKRDEIKTKTKLAGTHVQAPFSGTLERLLVEEGDYVLEGQEVAEVLDYNPLSLKLEYPKKKQSCYERE